MHPADTDKKSAVAMYLFDIAIDSRKYGGDIPAKSWEDAQACVEKFGGRIIGRSELEIYDKKICSICAGDMIIDTSAPKPIDDEFPDLIDES